VARRVGDDEFASVRREKSIGDVDGDALLALCGKAVDQQGEVDLRAPCPDLSGVGFQLGQMIGEYHL